MFRSTVTALFLSLTLLSMLSQAEEGLSSDSTQELTAEQIAARGFDEPPSGGDFTLTSVNGPVSTKDFRGKLILLYFGYTKCPDICPSSLATLAQSLNTLNEEQAEKVQLLFVTVDPKRDTPEVLAKYVQYFHENSVGVTGTKEEIAEVAKLYGAQYYRVELKDSAFGYAVNHSGMIYLLTADGALRFIFPHGTPPSVVHEAMVYVMPK